MLKICRKCNTEKDLEDFAWRNKQQLKKQSWCKECHKKEDKDRYYKGPRKQQCINANYKHRQIILSYLQEIKLKTGCTICGYKVCAGALDFHHIDSSLKDMNIGNMIANTWSLDIIQQEISKCIVLCCRCHRELHDVEDEAVESPALQAG